MTQKIIGRDEERRELTNLYESQRPEFVVVNGRRRVGKTFLIREMFASCMTFHHTGLSPTVDATSAASALKMQLTAFYSTLLRHGYQGDMPKTWFEAFDALRDILESRDTAERLVVFIDEMPWMDTPRSNFVPALEHFWNGWGAGRANLMLIACGSATSWLCDKVINSKGGLYNRVTAEITLRPFTLAECEELYAELGIAMSRFDQTQAYMAVGGIPYYATLMDKRNSLAQNIDRLFFAKGAKLADEFRRLFSSLFADPKDHISIVRLLAKRRGGYSRKEIADIAGLPYGGGLTSTLKALEVSDFIEAYVPHGQSARNTRYRLTDPFCLFYLRFVDGQRITDPKFWQNNATSPSMIAWRGLAFENVCAMHLEQMKRALGIGGVHTTSSPWLCKRDEGGAQIDLVIQRADNVINLCEMKFCNSDFRIDKQYEGELRNKTCAFQEETRSRASIHLTIVTTFGLARNEYSGMAQSVITVDDLFAKLK